MRATLYVMRTGQLDSINHHDLTINSPKFDMNFLHWIVLVLAFAISSTRGDRWDCGPCGGGPLNSPGAKALDTCALNCIQAAPAGTQCENNPSSDCICSGAHYGLAIQAISNCAMASCNIAQDLAAATSVASTVEPNCTTSLGDPIHQYSYYYFLANAVHNDKQPEWCPNCEW